MTDEEMAADEAAEGARNESEEANTEDAEEADEDGEEVVANKTGKVAKKKKKEEKKGLALGKHYYAFVVQSVTSSGTPVRFIAARYCVANMSHRWLRLKLEYIEGALAFYGFIACAESFDGASENRSYICNRITMTFRDLCKDLLQKNPLDAELEEHWDDLQRKARVAMGEEEEQEEEQQQPQHEEEDSGDRGEDVDMELNTEDMELEHWKYAEEDLPWDMGVAFEHPTAEGVIIVAAADMGHTLKKKRNAMKHSGNDDKKRDLHLNGLPINLRMAHDVWQKTSDGDPSNPDLQKYRNLSKSVFVPTSKSAMRTSDAARAQGNTMKSMLQDYGVARHVRPDRAGPRTYDSYILHCEMTDHWVNVMNATRSKGCGLISSTTHPHIYDLCNYVKYLKNWKDSVSDPNLFFPFSTYQDACWTSFGPVVLALYYLPKHPGHTINQMHLGSDPCETTFNLSRNANPNASKKDTDHIMAGLHGGIVSHLGASRKGNVGQQTTYYSNELDVGKIKRERKSKRRK